MFVSCVCRLMYVYMLVLTHITVRLRRITSCVVIYNTVSLETGALIGLELTTYAILAAREHSTLQCAHPKSSSWQAGVLQ